MATLDELARRLAVAGQLLDAAAADIRDVPLQPVDANIRAIGEALTTVFQLQHAIFALRPDLEPTFLGQLGPQSDANRRLTIALADAYRLAEEGSFAEGTAQLRSFASAEPSELHKRIADAEAGRIEEMRRK